MLEALGGGGGRREKLWILPPTPRGALLISSFHDLRNFHKFHNLRDTYATRRWAITGDILAVSKEIGHTSVKMTEKYTKFNLRRLMNDFPSIAPMIQMRLGKSTMDKGLNRIALNYLQLG